MQIRHNLAGYAYFSNGQKENAARSAGIFIDVAARIFTRSDLDELSIINKYSDELHLCSL